MKLFPILGLALLAPLVSSAAITNYPNPNSSYVSNSAEYALTGDGTTVPVYDLLCTNGSTSVNFRVARFAFVDLSSPCTVTVTYTNTANIDPQAPGIHSYTISPASAVANVQHTSSSVLTFQLLQPSNVEVSINGGTTQDTDAHASQLLYIFADAPGTSPENTWTVPNHPSNVYFFGPGDNSPPAGAVYNGNQWLIDGTTDTHTAVYLAPGAVLNANVRIINMRGGSATSPSFKVYGPGYMRDTTRTNPIVNVRNSSYVTVQDLCVFNAKGFSTAMDATSGNESDNITVSNVRALGIEVNSDALQICGPIGPLTAQNCFLVGNDNLIVLGGGTTNSEPIGPHNVTVEDCTFAKSRYAGNWFFAQGNSITQTNPTPGGEIGTNNVFTNCELIRANTNQVALITDWWGDLHNVGTTSARGAVISNLQVDSLAQYLYGSASGTSPYLNNIIALGMTGMSQTNIPTERPTTDSLGNPYYRSLTLRNVYLPTLSSPQTNYVKSNWIVDFDHVYVNEIPITSDNDLTLTKGANATTTYEYTFPPTGLAATVASATTVNLSWNAAVSNVTVQGYNVYSASSPAGPWTLVNSGLISGTSCSDASTQQNTTYYFAVTAVDAVTESPMSATTSVTPVDVTGVTLAPASGDGTLVNPGDTVQMVATVSPSNATDKAVTWYSNTTSTATVDANGLVTAVGVGDAAIKVTTVEGGFTAYYHVAVPYPAASATYAGGATLVNNHTGAMTGNGYFADFPTSGGTVTFQNVDGDSGGECRIVIRYSMATGPRTGTLVVNGVAQSLTFSQTTADWNTWTTTTVTVKGFTANRTNKIQFESTGQDFPNIDYIAVFN